jgi:lysine 2,3-aminomutase
VFVGLKDGDMKAGSILPVLSGVFDSTPRIDESDWTDWGWQMRHRLRTVEALEQYIRLSDDERAAIEQHGSRFRIDLTPYFASLLAKDDPSCPLRKQVIPSLAESEEFLAQRADPLGEDDDSPVPLIVHRYPDRVGLLVTTECASYCRFCTRSRMVGKPLPVNAADRYEEGLRYIREHRAVRDVLLTGGDALLLQDHQLDQLLSRIREIPHVDVVRMSTRVPIFLPQRVTPELVQVLRKHHPFWMNINVNHPKELTVEAERAVRLLADGGIPLGSQSVLMAGVNDCLEVIRTLMHRLVRNRVRPYYLYLCDPVMGAGHFRTPVSVGIEIMEGLRGHTSGYAVPTLVIDAPGGGGKTPVGPNYLISNSPQSTVIRNFEGMIVSYPEPATYSRHDKSTCSFCLSGEQTRSGVVAVAGDPTLYIRPTLEREDG